MKTKRELGMDAGRLAIMLFKENAQRGAKLKYGHNLNTFRKYLTENVISGTYPMPKVYATMEGYSKTEKSSNAINSFVMDIATAGLTNSSFYTCAGRDESKEWPWIGEEFENGFVECIMQYGHGGKREGAGRPATGRKRQSFYVTDEENKKLREYLEKIRD